MADPIQSGDKAAFVAEPAKYERRIAAFYDIMGWQKKIEAAGNVIAQVTMLKNIVRLFSSLQGEMHSGTTFATRVTTFSDNVVVSTVPSIHAMHTFVVHLARTQLMAAQFGCLLRGGMTVGNIFHDEHVVFGPALNRAYELETHLRHFLGKCVSETRIKPGFEGCAAAKRSATYSAFYR